MFGYIWCELHLITCPCDSLLYTIRLMMCSMHKTMGYDCLDLSLLGIWRTWNTTVHVIWNRCFSHTRPLIVPVFACRSHIAAYSGRWMSVYLCSSLVRWSLDPIHLIGGSTPVLPILNCLSCSCANTTYLMESCRIRCSLLVGSSSARWWLPGRGSFRSITSAR